MALRRTKLENNDHIEIYVVVDDKLMEETSNLHFLWELSVQELESNTTTRAHQNTEELQKRIKHVLFDLGTQYSKSAKMGQPLKSILKLPVDKVIGFHGYLTLNDEIAGKYVFAKIKVDKTSARISENVVKVGAEYIETDGSPSITQGDKIQLKLQEADQVLPSSYPILSIHDREGNIRLPHHTEALKYFYRFKEESVKKVSSYINELKNELRSVFKANEVRKKIKLLIWQKTLASIKDNYNAALSLEGILEITINLRSLIRNMLKTITEQELVSMGLDSKSASEFISNIGVGKIFYAGSFLLGNRTLDINAELIEAEELFAQKFSSRFIQAVELEVQQPTYS